MLVILGGCKTRQLAKPTPQMNVEPQFWVRVLLLDDVTECVLKTGSSFSVINPQTQTTQGRFDQIDEPAKTTISNGIITIAGRQFKSNEVVIAPDIPHIFNLNGNDYRGKLKLIADASGNHLDAINLIPLEPYIAGVVGAEMPDYWEPAALQAQAIAARTYCLYYKRQFGINRNWDVQKTQANQVYLGVKAESTQVWDAVDRTYGKVLVCNHADGSENIFPAYYSSACGGHTENSKNVFGDSFETLAGVQCPYCQDVARLNYFFWPMVRFDKSYVTTKLLQKYPKLKNLGKITNITAVEQSEYGKFSRMTKIKLSGSTGKSDFLRAEDLRLTIDPSGNKIKSTICQIIDMGDKWAFSLGRGWGHGVGMCQCGAQGMARKGKNAEQILFYYYPGSKVVSIY
jgi:stage II sporulation protein D